MATPSQTKQEQAFWPAGKIIGATLLVVALVVAFWLIYHFRILFFFMFIAAILSSALRPAAQWLQARGVPKTLSILLLYLLLLGLLVGIGFLIVPMILEQMTSIGAELPDYYQQLHEWLLKSRWVLVRRLGMRLPPTIRLLPEVAEDAPPIEEGDGFIWLTYTGVLARTLLLLIVLAFLTFYWVLEGPLLLRYLALWIPQPQREEARELIQEIDAKLGSYVRGQLLLCGIIAAMSLVAYVLIGLPYALVLALVAGIFEAIPMIGPFLGALPALLVALTISPLHALWVAVAAEVIQVTENNLLVPRVMGEVVGVHPIVTLLALAALTSLLGLPGAILAIPLAATAQLLLDHFVFTRTLENPAPARAEVAREQAGVGRLRYEAQQLASDVRKRMKSNAGEAAEDEDEDSGADFEERIEALALDLDQVLGRFAEHQEEET